MKSTLFIFYVLTTCFSFGQFTSNLVSVRLNCSTLIDIDNDNDLDFVGGSAHNEIIYKKNNGNGQYGEIKSIPTSSNVKKIMSIDVDQDGLNDLIVYCNDFNVKWFKNNGDGSFATAITLFQTNIFYPTQYIYTVDVDSDGLKDVIFTYNNYNTSFCWSKNLGNSTFSAVNIIDNGTYNISFLSVYDLNQDGLMDLLYKDSYNLICCFNIGGGVFGPEVVITNNHPYSIVAVDLDNDNDLDICIGSQYDEKISWFENINSTSFGPEQIVQSNVYPFGEVNFTDIDNDGNQDIIATINFEIIAYKNSGNGTFSNGIFLSTADNGNFGLKIADIDVDGQDDIYFENPSIIWNKKNGPDNFATSTSIYLAPVGSKYADAADFDGDGKPDIIVASEGANNTVCLFKNQGGNEFSTGNRITNLSQYSIVKNADLNNDGYIDIIANNISATGWFQNLGNGTFDNFVALIGQENTHDIQIGDLNNDGNLDIVIAQAYSFFWIKNLGGNQFESFAPIPYDNQSNIALSDINNDNWIDIIYSSQNSLIWRQNLGNETFGSEQIITTLTNYPKSICSADMDGDGFLDIVSVSFNDNKTAWNKNLGNGQFDIQQIISQQITNPTKLALGDLNGDGNIDIITGNATEISWFENIGNGQFNSKIVLRNNLTELSSLTAKEIDGDGDIDILFTTLNDDYVCVLSNNYIHDYQVTGQLFYDKNQNGIFENSDVGIPNVSILTSPSSSYSFTYENGNFNTIFNDTIGTYTLFPEQIDHWNVASTPSSYQINVTPNFTTQGNLNFGFYPDSLYEEITPLLIAAPSHCNDTVTYWLDINNTGTLKNSGIIELKLDILNLFYSSSNPQDSIVGNSIFWHYDSLEVFNHIQFNITVVMPDYQSINNTLVDSLKVFTLDINGLQNEEFYSIRSQVLTCAYDPNDKTVYPKGTTNLGYVPTDTEWLEYVVRFQNTGNASATNVKIEDDLDDNIEKIIILSSSHSMHTVVDENDKVSFMFDNINLPDSNSNFAGSQGYVSYKAKLKDNLPEGTQISNIAFIYFDFNPAVITNSVLNTLHDEETSSLFELVNDVTVHLYPNPFKEKVTIELKNLDSKEYYLEAYNTLGQMIVSKTLFEADKIDLFKSELGGGMIFFKLFTQNHDLVKVIKAISFE